MDRWRLIEAGETHTRSKGGEVVQLFAADTPGGCLASLLPTERRRMAEALALAPTEPGQEKPAASRRRLRASKASKIKCQVDVQDVQHNPDARDRTVKANDPLFMCLIKRSGILVRTDLLRDGHSDTQFVCSTDLATLMGFPVLQTHAVAAGAPSLFTEGLPAPASRTGATTRARLGNAMHVTHIGALGLVALARLPALGATDLLHVAAEAELDAPEPATRGAKRQLDQGVLEGRTPPRSPRTRKAARG